MKKQADRKSVDVINDDSELAPPCDRELMFNIMKNRDNSPGSVKFYQGDTLKYWDEENECKAVQRRIMDEGLRVLKEFNK